MKLTPWFSGSIKPVHVGVYQRDYDAKDPAPCYCYWDGQHWYIWADTPNEAITNKNLPSSHYQDLPWRGVLK